MKEYQFIIGDTIECMSADAYTKVGKKYIVSRANFIYSDVTKWECIEIEEGNSSPYRAQDFKLIKRANIRIEPQIFN